MCSYHVPLVPIVFPKGVPNSSSVYPISFAQSSPHLTHIYRWAKGEAIHLHIEIVILGNFQNLIFKIGSSFKKKNWNLRNNPFNELKKGFIFPLWKISQKYSIDNGWQITKEKKSQVFSLLCGWKQLRKFLNLDLETLI